MTVAGRGVNRESLDETVLMVQQAALHPGTRRQYQSAVQRWTVFCCRSAPHLHPFHLLATWRSAAALDTCVARYLAFLYQQRGGGGRQLGVSTVYGLYNVYPEVRDKLVRSELFLQGWARLRPSVSRPPLTWPLATFFAVTMAANGYGDGAVATLVAFDAFLRISEFTALRVADVSPPRDSRRGVAGMPSAEPAFSQRVIIRLAVTKTGRNQWVALYNADVAALLLRHVRGRPSTALVFDLNASAPSVSAAVAYRHAFAEVKRAVGLGDFPFTPHSLRHGGATHAMQHLGHGIADVMHRGRWRSASSATRYLQAGVAQLLQQSISADVLDKADRAAVSWSVLLHRYLGYVS